MSVVIRMTSSEWKAAEKCLGADQVSLTYGGDGCLVAIAMGDVGHVRECLGDVGGSPTDVYHRAVVIGKIDQCLFMSGDDHLCVNKVATCSGNSGRIYVPKAWVGCRVCAIRMSCES